MAARLIVPLAERVIACNVRGRSETTSKSDRIDADELCALAARRSLPQRREAASGTRSAASVC